MKETVYTALEHLEHSDQSSIVNYFETLELKWKLDNDITNCFIKIVSNFNMSNICDIDINFIETEKNKIIWEILGVQTKFKKLVEISDEDENNYKQRWEKLIEKIYYSERLLRTHYLLNQTNKHECYIGLNKDNFK